MSLNNRKIAWIAAGFTAVGLAMSPAIGAALSAGLASDSAGLRASGTLGSFTPASTDTRLSKGFKLKALRGKKGFHFTPAGTDRFAKRAVTIAVRTQQPSSKAVNIRESLEIASSDVGGSDNSQKLQLLPTPYSLGVAKGWSKFALPVKAVGTGRDSLASFDLGLVAPKTSTPEKRSKFSTRVELDAKSVVGSVPRALDGIKDYSLDVGGSYSLTRNLNVTAGVRLRQEQDRMAPLTDERQDSQAVYVGTQFRF